MRRLLSISACVAAFVYVGPVNFERAEAQTCGAVLNGCLNTADFGGGVGVAAADASVDFGYSYGYVFGTGRANAPAFSFARAQAAAFGHGAAKFGGHCLHRHGHG